MRSFPRPLLAAALTLTLALAGCTSPEESGDPGEGAQNAEFSPPPSHIAVDENATGDAPGAFPASVTRADAHVVADLSFARAADDGVDGVVTVALRFVAPDGHVLLERAVDLHPGQSTTARTEASLSGLTNWWNTHPDAEHAVVTLEVEPSDGYVDVRGSYGVPQ